MARHDHDSEMSKPQPAGAERRKSPRTAAVIRVDYSTVDDFFSDFTTNINEGGMFVETDVPHPIDTLVSLQFSLPGTEQPIQVRGRVVWVQSEPSVDGEPPGMGIEFEDLSDEDRAQINQVVRNLRSA